MNANIDFIGKSGGQGEVANHMMSAGRLDFGAMRPFIGKDGKAYITVFKGGNAADIKNYSTFPVQTNATLRREEWQMLDEAIIPVAEYRLNGVQDLINAGLTYNLGNAMGTTVLESHTVGDAMEAELTMDGVTRSQGDRPTFASVYLPIPIIHVDYEINARVLEASRKLGNPLDTTSAERAARRVAEYLENMLFTATTYTFGGGTVYSYLNFPQRNTYSISAAWTASDGDPVGDVIAMKQASINDYFYGPWMVYIPTEYETVMDQDYSTSGQSTQTIRDRILKIGGITDVKVVDTLPAGNVLLVQLTSDVVRLVRGMGIQNVQWQTEGNFVNKFKVLTIQVPQIRADQNGRTGIVHGSTS